MQSIDMSAFKKLVPKHFNKFEYSPSIGASGGILMGWNVSLFTGCMIDSSRHHIIVEFTSNHNAEKWTLSTVYAPCQCIEKQDFIDWFNNLQIPANCNWMILVDFNMHRSLEDRNKAGGNMSDIFTFNEIISNLAFKKSLLREEITPGQTCRRNLFWNRLIGASPLIVGFHRTLIRSCCLCPALLLIIFPAKFRLEPQFPSLKSSYLKITGWINLSS
jgi:hypothetical protein